MVLDGPRRRDHAQRENADDPDPYTHRRAQYRGSGRGRADAGGEGVAVLGRDFWYTAPVERPACRRSWSPTARTACAGSRRGRPRRARGQRAGHLLPAGGRRSARAGTPTLLERVGDGARPGGARPGRRTSSSGRASTSSARRCAAATSSTSRRTRSSAGVLGAALVRGLQAPGRRRLAEALRGQQPGDRPHAGQRRRRRADAARDLPARRSSAWSPSAQPWTVMCAYNKLNGVYASQHPWLLTDGAARRVGLRRARRLRLGRGRRPGRRRSRPGWTWRCRRATASADAALVEAVRSRRAGRGRRRHRGDRGCSTLVALVAAARRTGGTLRRGRPPRAGPRGRGRSVGAAEERRRAAAAARAGARIAVIGEFARTPRYQGGGSSHVNPTRLDDALDALRALGGSRSRFAPGFPSTVPRRGDGARDEAVAARRRRRRRCRVPRRCPARDESEGFDRDAHRPARRARSSCSTPCSRPTRAPSSCCPTAASSRWRAGPTGSRRSWRAGCSARPAAAPSPTCCSARSTRPAGWPRPSRCGWRTPPRTSNFPGEHGHVRYGEGVFVGYRWLRRAATVRCSFPFGHGLSYTTFEHSGLR